MSNTDDGSPPSPRGQDPRWWRPALPNPEQRARYTVQLRLMIDGLELALRQQRGESATIAAYPGGDLGLTDFLYRSDTILVRPEAFGGVVDELALTTDELEPGGRLPEQVDWLRVVPLPVDRRWTDDGEALTPAESALAHLEGVFAPGTVGFDRVLHLTSNSGCPATEPRPAPVGPDPAVNGDATLGNGVTVAVIDSGWPNEDGVPVVFPPGHWLAGVTGDPELGGMNVDPKQEALLAHYRGHGMFVAGVIRAMAPAAEVYVHSWGPTTYGQIESELAPILSAVLDGQPDIISMSAGTGGADDPPEESSSTGPRRATVTSQQPALSLDAFRDKLRPTSTLLVCAAGNDGDQGPFAPASSPWSVPDELPIKVAVGALKKKGRLAKYSNRGMWVDVYARGSKLVNAYPNGRYTYEEPPYTGHSAVFSDRSAQWSGTSFSTPLVAGLVAARRSWSQQPPREAWASLERIAYAWAPYGLPTLRPGDADRGIEPPP